MDDTTRSIIERITTKYPTAQPLPGGHQGTIFYDVDRLTPNDLARLAATATGHLDPHGFDVAVGLAYSGILFAGAIAGGREVGIIQKDGEFRGPNLNGKKILIVSDIVFEGKELLAAAKNPAFANAKLVGYACIIDRSNGKFGGESCPLHAALRTDLS